MTQLVKDILGLIGVLAFCAMIYMLLGGACVASHGLAACTMENSDQ